MCDINIENSKKDIKFPLLSISSLRTINLCKQLPNKYNSNYTIFICSYPKSGTTWMQAIIFNILLENNRINIELDHISNYSPFYEIDKTWNDHNNEINQKYINNFNKLGYNVFNTHLYRQMLPYGDSFKYIYVIRDPIDIVVSFYHHLSNQLDSSGFNGSFDNFFNLWLNGDIIFGKWIDHVSNWLDNNNLNRLIVKYEDLINKPKETINNIICYLNINLTEESTDNIIKKTSFHSMKENISNYHPVSVDWKIGYQFIRKGMIGDGKSLVSQQQINIFKDDICNKFGGTIPDWLNTYINLNNY